MDAMTRASLLRLSRWVAEGRAELEQWMLAAILGDLQEKVQVLEVKLEETNKGKQETERLLAIANEKLATS